MGILNITGDSFYAASRHMANDDLLNKAEQMLETGADILDIGGQSTRPGSTLLSSEEEAASVIPAITTVCKKFPEAIVSVDTFYSEVAKKAIDAGAAIVNDISAGSMDANMFDTISQLKVPYVLMHMQGNPATMQERPQYKDVTLEVLDFMIEKIGLLKSKGVTDIIVDPGFGFGKTIEHNFQLLKNLKQFNLLGHPLLLGVSRKGTIYKTLNTTAENALNGTTVLNTIGLLNGAGILRVHDVKEAREAILLIQAYQNA